MNLKELIKYFLRFLTLQIILTSLTIFYFDRFLIGDYKEGYDIIIFNLIEDRDRFYSFMPNQFLKIDIYLSVFVFVFLIILYSTRFYTYVNELTFSESKNYFDEFFSIYLLWTSSLFVFITIFRFTSISRVYLFLFTLIGPLILIGLRNSEALSSLLGRSPKSENYISFNLDEESVFQKLRILMFRKSVANIKVENFNNYKQVIENIDSENKKNSLSLVVINLKNENSLPGELLDYLVKLNKKILLISKQEINFERIFLKRSEFLSNNYLTYFNNDIQYGSKFILKRGIDIIFSIFTIVLLLPLILFVYFYILFLDGRPVVINQKRIGLHGEKFNMYKFRTMKIDSHNLREDLADMNQKDGLLFKIENDPRILPGSEKLRKYSLDELPQFINVLKGDMSIVGPRPLFDEDMQKYNHKYMRRLNVLPGITGLLQINERNAPEFETWYKYDLQYIENWSLYLDFKIIIQTPISLFSKQTRGV